MPSQNDARKESKHFERYSNSTTVNKDRCGTITDLL